MIKKIAPVLFPPFILCFLNWFSYFNLPLFYSPATPLLIGLASYALRIPFSFFGRNSLEVIGISQLIFFYNIFYTFLTFLTVSFFYFVHDSFIVCFSEESHFSCFHFLLRCLFRDSHDSDQSDCFSSSFFRDFIVSQKSIYTLVKSFCTGKESLYSLQFHRLVFHSARSLFLSL